VVSTLGCSVRMSMPSSSIASTAVGLIWSAGAEPAERTSTAPPDRARRYPAAICDRPALCTQTNRADGLVSVGWVIGLSWVVGSGQRERGGLVGRGARSGEV